MQRFSISVDDDLAEWIESMADDRGVSKAKIIRDAVETAQVTGLVKTGELGAIEEESLAERVANLEQRLDALEQSSDHTAEDSEDSENTAEGIVSAFSDQLEGRPPTTEHGEAAVVRVFELLIENGPMKTKELRETIYPEFEDQFATANSMWQSTQRHFDNLRGIEKVGHGKWDADPGNVVSYEE